MDNVGQIAVDKAVMAQLENNLEAATFTARICRKIDDDKGLEQAKLQVVDFEKRIQAADELIKEAEDSAVKTVQIV